MKATATFVERASCLNCASVDLETLWTSRFSDRFVSDNLKRDSYSSDLEELLADSQIQMVRCNRCDLAFHKYRLNDEWLGTLYNTWINEDQIQKYEAIDAVAQGRCSRFEQGRQRLKHVLRIRDLLAHLNSECYRLLDFGCGDGEFLRAADVFAFECFGVDFSAVRRERGSNVGVSIAQDLDALDRITHGKTMHAVTLFETLEHVADPLGLLRALWARMQESGVLLVEVPDCSGICAPKNRSEFHRVHPLEHINNFTPKTLERLCATAGFRRIAAPAAHVTTRKFDLIKSELGRFLKPRNTSQYFRKVAR